MKNVIIFSDHTIGYEVTRYCTRHLSEQYQLLGVFTPQANNQGFWKPIKEIGYKDFGYFINESDFLVANDHLIDKIDYIFLISWKYILSGKFIDLAKEGVINLHYSLLPKFRGVYPVNWAIINGQKQTGITYHWVNPKIDQGEIILQRKTDIPAHFTALELINKLDLLAFDAFKDIWEGVVPLDRKNSRKQFAQDEQYYSNKRFTESNLLDLNKNYQAEDLINLLRGKTFADSNNLYFLDGENRKVYLSISLRVEE